jgi:uncharacterized protein YndB with AHSA1/START domain
MHKRFEVTFDGVMDATPEDVWDAVTVHAGGWLWPVSYEPRAGGRETGLAGDGSVTVWEPARRFVTRAEREGGWFNQLEYELEPRDGGRTLMRYRHTSLLEEAEYDVQLDACRCHTAFYNHSLGEYVRHFARRDAAYVSVDGPERPGTLAAVLAALGVPDDASAGDRVRVTGPEPIEGVIDYRTPAFLGVRAEDSLLRVYGREGWGMPLQVAQHQFAGGAGEDAWRVWLDEALVRVEA